MKFVYMVDMVCMYLILALGGTATVLISSYVDSTFQIQIYT